MRRVLITGGAGFIGSHLGDLLLSRGHHVRILDNLNPQVHPEGARPDYLAAEIELHRGDVRDADAVRRAVDGVDSVVHLAAAVGVGQSMYRIAHYTSINDLGTAILLEALMERPIERLVVASSMSVYGEGSCVDAGGQPVEPRERTLEQLRQGRWESQDEAGAPLAPAPTAETKSPGLSSIYALGKYMQERACLMWGRAYDVPTTALRLFNVYGSRQALSNPYTGVMAIFASRILNGRAPLVFEDGRQQRDFVHVRDVALACLAAIERPAAGGHAINVGSGVARTIEEVAQSVARALGRAEIAPEISGQYRAGDIRHCFADTGLMRDLLEVDAATDFDLALVELAEWLKSEVAIDRVDKATDELVARGLVG